MHVTINGTRHQLPNGATLADAVRLQSPSAPFAAARNMDFVPRTRYQTTPLEDGDRIDLISPVTGG